MRKINLTILALLIFTCNMAFSTEFIGTKIKQQDAQSVSNRANQYSSVGSGEENIISDPFLEATMGGMKNMIQGFSNNSYNMQEQAKQQADYAKQQANN